MKAKQTIIVFSHLRWNWVWQRPQHLLSRLADTFDILFIEEPMPCADNQVAHWHFKQTSPSVLVCTPYTRSDKPGFHRMQLHELGHLVDTLIEQQGIRQPLAWLYTPMALPLAKRLRPDGMIYDVMDELSAFKDAPPELLDWESEAYRCVDVVFTGGPSLYRAKCTRHPYVHCFPSSVDTAHFAKARQSCIDHIEQIKLPQPRLGFFGVIDERIDLNLINQVAQRQPNWQIIMVGPVTKISPSDLPCQPNIHYLGQQPYEILPAFVAGWDVCLLPFARNESTRFISPTKTLEYMAAEKPIVSTSITDVVEPYGDIVYIGDTVDDFLSACDSALYQTVAHRQQRLAKMHRVLTNTSWDTTALAMTKQINTILYGNHSTLPHAMVESEPIIAA